VLECGRETAEKRGRDNNVGCMLGSWRPLGQNRYQVWIEREKAEGEGGNLNRVFPFISLHGNRGARIGGP
jgi:hypothetical protein